MEQNVYFSLGEALAALGFTIIILQFLKPIYLFRLQAIGIQKWYLFVPIFWGFICAIIAAMVPVQEHFLPRDLLFLNKSKIWEMIGAISVGLSYFFVVFIALKPASVRNGNLIAFVRAGVKFLSEANDEDRISFVKDLSNNIDKLVSYTRAWERAHGHAVYMEFERLKEIKAPEPHSVRGRQKVSAFYLFTHRQELDRASWSAAFLNILSDPDFCSALVRLCPWQISEMLNKINDQEIYSPQLEEFVQEVAKQAVLQDGSLIAKEAGFGGFGRVSILSDSLFTNTFILSNYQTLEKLRFINAKWFNEPCLKRINKATKMALNAALKKKDYHDMGHLYLSPIEDIYEDLFVRLSAMQEVDYGYRSSIYSGVCDLYKLLLKHFEDMEAVEYNSLFAKDGHYQSNITYLVARVIYESLAHASNSEYYWHHTHRVWRDIYYPHYSTEEPKGLNPLQQQLAILVIRKLRENMCGWYPPLLKSVLSVVGSCDDNNREKHTASSIMMDAVYREFLELPKFYKEDAEKMAKFMPNNVRYKDKGKLLEYTYAGGEKVITKLSTLKKIAPVDLFDEKNWLKKEAAK